MKTISMRILLFLLFIPVFAYSQNKIEGFVINSETNNPVKDALVIYNDNKGTVVDNRGYFELPDFVNVLNIEFLTVRCLGYESRTVKSTFFQVNDTLELKPVAYEVPEISVIENRRKTKFIGINKSKHSGNIFEPAGGIVALKVMPYKKSYTVLKNIQFYIVANNFNPDNLFRVHIFKLDQDGSPGKDLVTDSLIVAPTRGEKWVSVDVSNYVIHVPNDGLFLGVEYLSSGRKACKKNVCTYKKTSIQTTYWQNKNDFTWRYNPKTQKWIHWKDGWRDGDLINYPNAMIKAEVFVK